ncbi:MAG: molybdate ABC transporter substrate-binding protein [Candidatus Brocadiia bacterium]
MQVRKGLAVLGLAAGLLCGCGEQKQIEVFVGSASKPATEEAAKVFEQKTGCKVLLHIGGSGKLLSDMEVAERGDLYFPGSSDFMERAKEKELVVPETEEIVVYLVPAINVPAENPADIQGLQDLAEKDVSIGIARPDTVCVGLYAAEVLVHNGLVEAVKPKIKTHAPSCARTANLVAMEQVDAILGWRVFGYWAPEKIKTILLEPEQVPRIGYIPIARSVFSEEPELAEEFVRFLLSDEGRAIFRKHHYLTTEAEARKFVTLDTPVGGKWELPEAWLEKD